MPPFSAASGVSVEVEGNAVVVTLPEGITIDPSAARAINDEYLKRIRSDAITGALTVLEDGVTLSERAFEAIGDAAAAGCALGLDRWAVVGADRTDADLFSDRVVGLETRIFESKTAAITWLAEA